MRVPFWHFLRFRHILVRVSVSVYFSAQLFGLRFSVVSDNLVIFYIAFSVGGEVPQLQYTCWFEGVACAGLSLRCSFLFAIDSQKVLVPPRPSFSDFFSVQLGWATVGLQLTAISSCLLWRHLLLSSFLKEIRTPPPRRERTYFRLRESQCSTLKIQSTA